MQVITWQEINAWQEATHNKSIWLAYVIRQLSENYINEYSLSNNAVRQSPLQADDEMQRAAVSKQFKNIFRGS